MQYLLAAVAFSGESFRTTPFITELDPFGKLNAPYMSTIKQKNPCTSEALSPCTLFSEYSVVLGFGKLRFAFLLSTCSAFLVSMASAAASSLFQPSLLCVSWLAH